jgi:tetratricopeptide (TPR) repeat protein
MDRGRVICGLAMSVVLVLSGCHQNGDAVYQPAVAKLIEKAGALKNENRLNEAICRLEAAADIAPQTYQVQYNLGVLYSQAERWLPAVTHLEKAVGISPGQPNTLYTLAYSYESLGDQYRAVAQSASPEELKSMPFPPEIKSLSKEEAAAKGQEAYQKAIETNEKFLQVAPSADPGRKDVEAQLSALKSKATQSAPTVPATP